MTNIQQFNKFSTKFSTTKKAGKAAKEGIDKVAGDTLNRAARRRKLIDGFKSGKPYTGD